MQKGIDGGISNSIYSDQQVIECGGRKRNESLESPRFRRIIHVGFYPLDASHAWLAFVVIQT